MLYINILNELRKFRPLKKVWLQKPDISRVVFAQWLVLHTRFMMQSNTESTEQTATHFYEINEAFFLKDESRVLLVHDLFFGNTSKLIANENIHIQGYSLKLKMDISWLLNIFTGWRMILYFGSYCTEFYCNREYMKDS